MVITKLPISAKLPRDVQSVKLQQSLVGMSHVRTVFLGAQNEQVEPAPIASVSSLLNTLDPREIP